MGQLSRATGKRVIARALQDAAAPVIEAARDNVAVASGRLRDSLAITTKLSKRQRAKHRKQSEAEVFAGTAALPHAHLIEFGTKHHGPQPFMRPAWDANKEKVLEHIKGQLEQRIMVAVERAKRRAANRARKMGG